MMDYFQVTDSRMFFPRPYQQRDQRVAYPSLFPCKSSEVRLMTTGQSFSSMPGHDPGLQTTGGSTIGHFVLLPESSSLIKEALNALEATPDPKVAGFAITLLATLERIVTFFRLIEFDVGSLPPLIATNLDDGSVLLEWIFPHFRIGFNIEQDSKESGWYLVSSESLGAISASGCTQGQNTELLLVWLLHFAVTNA